MTFFMGRILEDVLPLIKMELKSEFRDKEFMREKNLRSIKTT